MRIFALLLALLLAGCLAGEEPVETQSADAAAATVDAAGAQEAPVTSAPEAAPVVAEFDFGWEGRTSTSICAPSGPNSCTGLPVSSPGENTFVELEYEGVPNAVEATITWSATTPATAEIYAYVFAARSCGESCWEMDDTMFGLFASGPSPLTLSAPDVVVREDEVLMIHLGTMDPTPPVPVAMGYSLEQAFSLEGVVRSLVPAETA